MIEVEIPSDDDVVAVLNGLGGRATALELCNALTARNNPILQSQIAIQRATDRGRIAINSDWSLSLPPRAVAA